MRYCTRHNSKTNYRRNQKR